MIEQIQKIEEEIESFNAKDTSDIEKFRIRFLGSKGLIKGLYALLREVPNENKKEFGQKINDLRSIAESKLNSLKGSNKKTVNKKSEEDLSKPTRADSVGSHHPLSIIKKLKIFLKNWLFNFRRPEIEDDWHNFSTLNLPEHHKRYQDTFFYSEGGMKKLHFAHQFCSGACNGK